MKKILISMSIVLIAVAAVISVVIFMNRSCRVVSGNDHVYSNQCLPDGYVPTLVKLSARASYLNATKELEPRAAQAAEQLISDAEKDGMCLVVIDGYRSQEDQQEIYDQAVANGRGEFVAIPHSSEHQTGFAVDFGGCPMKNGVRNDTVERLELANDFDTLPEYAWLKANAVRHGFEESFREDNIKDTGYPAEAWHWKFIIK